MAGTKIAPDGIAAWNPAFDVTPAGLITAIVTDKGLVPRKGGEGGGEKCFDVKAFCESNAASEVSWSAGFWGDGPVGGEPGWMNAGNLSVCQSVSLSVCLCRLSSCPVASDALQLRYICSFSLSAVEDMSSHDLPRTPNRSPASSSSSP